MSHTLSESKQQQVIGLGRLAWSLRRKEAETGIRRETASAYLRAAGVPVRARGGRPATWPPNPATTPEVSTDPLVTGFVSRASTARSVSSCAEHRETILAAVRLGRNARAIWQDLVTEHGYPAGYACVRRFVRTLRGEACQGSPSSTQLAITQIYAPVVRGVRGVGPPSGGEVAAVPYSSRVSSSRSQ